MTPHEFIRKWKDHALTERAAAQEHFIDLCHLFGHPTPAEADPTGKEFTFEKGAAIVGGGDGWADVWKKGYFAWEYKKRKRNLDDAMAQLTRYAASLESPPLLVACDTIRFQIKTTWTNLETKKYEFELEELADPEKFKLLRAVFHDPDALKPVRTRAKLTSDAADKFQAVSDALQSRHPDREAVAHFVNQLVFCFFADSVKLLPEGLLKKLLLTCERRPAKSKDYFDKLFEQMEKGGELDLTEIAWFNGGLFDGSRALPLAHVDIQNLIDATSLDWSLIDPTIFGTLFERFLDPDKRAQIGAHYTDPEKIMLIVEPVVLRPLRREWADVRGEIERVMAPAREAGLAGREGARNQGKKIAAARAKAEKLRDDFIERLTKLRILDPACGSGNFLYLALQGVKDLEYAAINDCETLGLDRPTTRVGPEILHGIEINPFAAELARTTIWIGDIQWAIKNAIFTRPQPFLKKLDSIEQRDAVLTADGKEAAWPEADFIVGNPPFLGGKLLRRGLGDGYVDRLFAAYDGRMPAEADLVCYWFAKAWAMVCSGRAKSAGLVATNSIRGGANRRVLEPIAEAGAIFEAWSDEPWTVEGAAVRVSIVCFARPHTEENAQRPSRSTRAGGAASQPSPHAEERLKGASRSTRADHATSSFETPASQAPQEEVACRLDGVVAVRINADLTAGLKLIEAKSQIENQAVCFEGYKKYGPFDIPGNIARAWLMEPLNANGRPNSDVLKPWLNALDVMRTNSDTWVVDFSGLSEQEAAFYQEPFKHAKGYVHPVRINDRAKRTRERWWLFERDRPTFRNKLCNLRRFIATPVVAKHRAFVWLDSRCLIANLLDAIARDDDTTFGILHSRFHEAWSLRLCTWLGVGNDPRYTPTTTFETFPFPEGLTPNIPAADYAHDPRAQRIAEAARALDEARRNWLNPPDLVEIVPEVVPGYPDRILPKDAQAAVKLKERTLTNLYNQRPQWLVNAHDKLDRAVAAAYGWPEDISTEDALAKLLELNLKRAAEG
ncbi:DNA methyltransferase [Methylocystis sp. Sn-Cys]|uniref:class I SAM-dependent DNA methyltransferase n=1 Tax=Methylocystis sp. Sn-Cys TaxID=1701263 RepID=UPI0019246898|nr:DNA methyltransferase [Methylocystis sp. Sn-Cys]MBL1257154.1 class I SAM-dependent DNA methyltransferase [Methylocystis sp. Sn-Cys]